MIGSKLGVWNLDQEIGRGGMGTVYLAHHVTEKTQAAVKVLAPELAREPGFRERFLREIEVLDKLSHPNIVRLLDSGFSEGLFYFAMEHVQGENYEGLLLRRGRLPWLEVVDVALQISPALKHAHDRGIIHRDLKPPNLLRSTDGVVKLTDFGIAKVFAAPHLTITGGVVGTAEYLSPEQATGKQATKRSDFYSLGAVLYHLVTGRAPFEGRNPTDILHKHVYAQFDRPAHLVDGLPHELDALLCQMLEKDPSKRPADGLFLYRQFDSIRKKQERVESQPKSALESAATVAQTRQVPEGVVDIESPTLLSQLVRGELLHQKVGGPIRQWFNRPVVLIPLFLLCVGTIYWTFWGRSRPAPEVLFARAEELMASANPADWESASRDFLEPLERHYPNHPYREQVDRFWSQIEDRRTLRRAVMGLPRQPQSEAQRLYNRGLRLCQDGDAAAARLVWQKLVVVFDGVDTEARWARLAASALQQLDERIAGLNDRLSQLQPIADHMQGLKKEGKLRELETLWRTLEGIYRDEPEVLDFLKLRK